MAVRTMEPGVALPPDQVEMEAEDFPGLCRVCGGTVPRANDPSSCTTSVCSEQCLARYIEAYWASFGLQAQVSLRDGFARLEAVPGILPGR
jgi:hypothetical protein